VQSFSFSFSFSYNRPLNRLPTVGTMYNVSLGNISEIIFYKVRYIPCTWMSPLHVTTACHHCMSPLRVTMHAEPFLCTLLLEVAHSASMCMDACVYYPFTCLQTPSPNPSHTPPHGSPKSSLVLAQFTVGALRNAPGDEHLVYITML
jgi:hypothetical protein